MCTAQFSAEESLCASVDCVDPLTGDTPLLVAVKYNNVKIVQLLVDKRANLECTTSKGYTPLSIACCKGYSGVVKVLLRFNPNSKKRSDLVAARRDVPSFNPEWTLLQYVAHQGFNEVIKMLIFPLSESKKAFEGQDSSGRRAVHFAAENGKLEVVEQLASAAADMDALDKEGCALYLDLKLLTRKHVARLTPLLLASDGGHLEVVQYLLEQGADVNIRDKRGMSCLASAAHSGNFNLVKILIAAEAELDQASKVRSDANILFHHFIKVVGQHAERLDTADVGCQKIFCRSGAIAHCKWSEDKRNKKGMSVWSADLLTVKHLMLLIRARKTRSRWPTSRWINSKMKQHNSRRMKLRLMNSRMKLLNSMPKFYKHR